MSLRERARSMATLAVPLELIEDEAGNLRGSWRGESIEVDAHSGRARIRVSTEPLSAEQVARSSELRIEHRDPQLVEALEDCLRSCRTAPMPLSDPTHSLRAGWLEAPIGDALAVARERLDVLVNAASGLRRLIVEAERLAAERRKVLARVEQARVSRERARTDAETVRAFARRRERAHFFKVAAEAGVATMLGAIPSFGLESAGDRLWWCIFACGLAGVLLAGFAARRAMRCPACGSGLRGAPRHQCPNCEAILIPRDPGSPP